MIGKVAAWSVVSALMAGLAAGFGLSLFTVPVPKQWDGCGVYKIDRRSVTSFVLKAPEPWPVDRVACPVAPKCETTNLPESVNPVEATNDDESKPRRHRRRHNRVRGYWR